MEMNFKTKVIESFKLSCLLAALFCIFTIQTEAQTPYTITWQGLQSNILAQNVPTGITVTQQYNGVTAACNTGQNGGTTSYSAQLTAAPGYNFTITSIGGAAYASSAGSKNFSVNLVNGSFNGTGPVTSIGTTTNCGGNSPLTPYAIPAAGQTVPAGTTVTITVIRAPGSASGNGYSWTRSLTVTGVVTPVSSNAIATSAVTTSLCEGAAISVPFTATGTFANGNIFTAQLSNAAGSFANPVNIGTLVGTSSGSINATLPMGTGAGTGYRIRVIGSNPSTTGTDNGANITIKVAPMVNLGNDTSFCSGAALNITLNAGNPGASYEWSNFSTNQTLNVSTAGTFSVTVTGANNCEATDQITVTELSLPIVNLGNDLAYCAGAPFAQTLNAGNTGASYEWNNGSVLQALNITQAGTYSVTVTDAHGCENADTIVVIENALPIVSLGNDLSYCMGSNFSQVLDAGNVGATFNWNSGAANTQTFNVTTPGTYSVVVTDANGCQNSDAVTVIENPLPVVDLGNNTLSYCAGTNFSQLLDAGNPGATYNWTKNLFTVGTLQTYTATSAGVYAVVVTDANGCQNADGIIITENSLPTVNLGSDLSYCVGSNFSHMFDAGNAGATYNWNNGFTNTQTLTVTTAGTYTVIVTNGNGCENTDVVVVTENALPMVNLGNDLAYCAGTNFSQILNAGNPNSNYNWNNGAASTQTFNVTTAGTYSVTVTNGNGCQNTDQIVVVENALPIVNLGNDMEYCAGTTFSQVLNAGNVGSNYNWNNGLASTQTLNITTAGTYSVLVTDGNGCQNSDAVIVTENALPIVNLGSDLSYCTGSNFMQTLNAGNVGASYDWNNGLASTPTFNATTAGNYSVIVTDANGCQGFDLITITENSLPVVQLGNDTAYCAGTTFSLLLNAQNIGSTYVWNNGAFTSQIFAVSQAGTYSVVVTDANGCQHSDAVIVTEYALPVVNLGNDTSYCTGSPLSLVLNAGNPGSSYSWGNGSITQSVTATQAGTYMVTVTDANGCVNSDQLIVTENALPVINLGNDVSTPNTFYVLNAGNGFSEYSWNPGGQTTPQITVTQSGTYSVTVANSDGCSASDVIVVSLGTSSVSEYSNNDVFTSVYPNPASDELHVKVGSEGEWRLELLSMDGKSLLLQYKTASESNQIFDINLQTFAAGTYMIRVSNSFQIDTKVFIVNR